MKNKKILSWLVAATMVLSSFAPMSSIKASAAVTSSTDVTEVTASSASGNFTLNGDTLNIVNGTDVIDLQICTANILRVNYKPAGAEDPNTLVLDPDKKWDTGNIVSSDLNADPAVIKTNNMIVKISKSDLSISVYDASNGLLIKQSSITDAKNISFTHNSGENFYGISGYGCGTSANDGTLRNNASYEVKCASQGWAGGPFTWSNGGYGLLVDSDGGKITTGDTSLSYGGISKKDAEYFIIVGKPEEIMKGVSQISGETPMYPKWAMGFTDTQWGWAGAGTIEDQVKSVIGTYRSKNIPIDNFCFDFDWKRWGDLSDYGEFTWNPASFPSAASGNLKKWCETNGIHFTGIVKPRVFTGKENGKDTAEFAEAKAGKWTFGGGSDYCASKDFVSIDYSTQAARDWWWKCTQKSFDLGLSGFWNDEIDQDNGYGNFGNFNAQRAQYEGQRKYTEDKTRVWSINRNFYLGAQRYSYGIWTGDINTGFESMKGQAGKLIAAVNLGENKWGMDTGGFNGGDPTSENYARWMEFSAFTPIFRVHGQDTRTAAQAPNTGRGVTPRYPWNFGTTAEAASKKVMQLRYQLIPYIYKYEHDASEGGTGLVKPLMMVYPKDKKVAGEVYSWMFGDNLLVSPVLDKGITTKSIYLPAGTWIDYTTGKTYAGGQTIDYAVNATTWDDVPLFVKQGAIIPTQDSENYVGEKKMTNIYVDVFPDVKETSFDYYDDDSNSYDYEKGNYFEQKLSVSRNADWTGVEFKTAAKEGTYTPDVQNYIVKLHVKATGAITAGGKELTKYATLDALKSATGEGYATGTDVYGDVVYAKVTAGEVKTINAPCTFAKAPSQTATIYAKTSDNSAKLQYSLDGGSTWSAGQAMTQSDKLGYLQSPITYTLTSNNPVKVRYSKGTGYSPSSDGVVLSGDSDVYTIAKDGTISSSIPAMNTSNIYIQAGGDNPVYIETKDQSGAWSNIMQASLYGTAKGQYSKSISYAVDDAAPTIRYTDDNGKTWKPSADGKTIGSGDYMNNSTGDIVSGKPKWSNTVVVYYKKSYATSYIHWRATGGTWDAVPGKKMEESDKTGYVKATLDIGEATSAEVCFNNGAGTWDDNGKKNYTLPTGVNTVDPGKVTSENTGSGNTIVTSDVKIQASIRGGSYASEQKVTLTASDSTASIYYTLDGTIPTAASTKYSGAITISDTKTIIAVAIDSKGNKSLLDLEAYRIGDVPVDPVDPVDPIKPINLTVQSSIKAGTYTSSQKVTLTASGSSATSTSIYYTLDGTIPSVSSTKYAGEITISKDTTLKAIAIDSEGNKSPIDQESYVIKTSPDTGTPSDPSDPIDLKVSSSIKGGTYTSSQTVTLIASDASASIYYTLDGTVPSTSSIRYTGIIIINKDTTLKAIAVDSKGNESSLDEENYVIKIDTNQGTVKDFNVVTISSNIESVKQGDKIIFTADVNNTTDPTVEYAFGYFDENNDWKFLRDSFSASNTFEWTTDVVGSFDVVAIAKSGSVTRQINSSKIKVTVTSSEKPGPVTFDNNSIVNVLAIMTLTSVALFISFRRKRVR